MLTRMQTNTVEKVKHFTPLYMVFVLGVMDEGFCLVSDDDLDEQVWSKSSGLHRCELIVCHAISNF